MDWWPFTFTSEGNLTENGAPSSWKLLFISRLSQHGAPLSDWLHDTGRHHGSLLWGRDHPEHAGDCGDAETQTVETAAQLCSGEPGCVWPGCCCVWRHPHHSDQCDGLFQLRAFGLCDGGLCCVLFWWVNKELSKFSISHVQ